MQRLAEISKYGVAGGHCTHELIEVSGVEERMKGRLIGQLEILL